MGGTTGKSSEMVCKIDNTGSLAELVAGTEDVGIELVGIDVGIGIDDANVEKGSELGNVDEERGVSEDVEDDVDAPSKSDDSPSRDDDGIEDDSGVIREGAAVTVTTTTLTTVEVVVTTADGEAEVEAGCEVMEAKLGERVAATELSLMLVLELESEEGEDEDTETEVIEDKTLKELVIAETEVEATEDVGADTEDKEVAGIDDASPEKGVGIIVLLGLGVGRPLGYESSKISSCAPSLKL